METNLYLHLQWADDLPVSSVKGTENPVISVNFKSETLSRFDDPVWFFPYSRQRPAGKRSVIWPEGNASDVKAAKQLALLRLTHGTSLAPNAARAIRSILASLVAYCGENRVALTDLHRHPAALIDFCQLGSTVQRRDVIRSISRMALALNKTLGWTFLEHSQIKALNAIKTIEPKQHPVIPLRIHNELDTIAHEILQGYLAVADEFKEVMEIWGPAPLKRRRKGKPAHWGFLMSRYPALADNFKKWQGRSISPVSSYIYVIRIAAIWVIASGSGARRSEILELRRGCLTNEWVVDTRSYLLRSGTSKTQTNSNAVWIVSPRLVIAIQSLEKLLDTYESVHPNPPVITDLLFQVFDITFGREHSPSEARIGKLQHGSPIEGIDFKILTTAAKTSITEDDWAKAKKLTPSLNREKFGPSKAWQPSIHQLRRTILVYAAASGLISQDSISFQAKHQTWQMGNYYCRNFWHLARNDKDNPLVTDTNQRDAEEFTQIYVDTYNRDREDIMESCRHFSPYGDDHKRAIISVTPLLSVEEIRQGQVRGVLKANTLGICTKADYCEWQKAITVRGCMTKAEGNVCSNAIIDSKRLSALRQVQEHLQYELESLHLRDLFAREQIEADLAATSQAIELITQYNRDHDAEKD